jgi:hypothetical protein
LPLFTELPRGRLLLGNSGLPAYEVLGNPHSPGPIGVTPYAADRDYRRVTAYTAVFTIIDPIDVAGINGLLV